MFEKALQRPSNFRHLDAETQWAIDNELGILDWDGNCSHQQNGMCSECRKRWEEHFDIPIRRIGREKPQMTIAIRMNADFTFETFHLGPELDDIYKAIGNGCETFQMIRCGNGYMLMDEDAKIKKDRPPLNKAATRFASVMGMGLAPGDQILGNVILVGVGQAGETADCPLELRVAAKQFFANGEHDYL